MQGFLSIESERRGDRLMGVLLVGFLTAGQGGISGVSDWLASEKLGREGTTTQILCAYTLVRIRNG